MSGQSKLLLKLISTAVGCANNAGENIRKIFHSGKLQVVSKGFQDFQTEADRLSQAIIISNLAERFPECLICGEEDGSVEYNKSYLLDLEDDKFIVDQEYPSQYANLTQKDITIWVDPLDGTSEFVSGKPESVTVLIGFSVKERAVAGVIHQVFCDYNTGCDVLSLKGRTIWALSGLGCFGVTPTPLPDDKLVVTTTSSHGNALINSAIESLRPHETIRVGGAGYKVLSIIEGKANCYVFPSNGCKKWDTCAPEAILEASGGRLTDIFGNLIEYKIRKDCKYANNFGVLASSNDDIHEKILAKIPDAIKLEVGKNVK